MFTVEDTCQTMNLLHHLHLIALYLVYESGSGKNKNRSYTQIREYIDEGITSVGVTRV